MFVAFFWDSNRFNGLIDTVEKWHVLREQYTTDEANKKAGEFYRAIGQSFTKKGGVDAVLAAKVAPKEAVDALPEGYHFGSPGVRTGEVQSFGYRREHTGELTLEEWAKSVGMDLRKL